MKVILRADIERLGSIGEVINVAPGHARNYLIPKKLAYLASEDNLKRIEHEKHIVVLQLDHEREETQKLATKMKDISLTFQVRVGEEDKLYGSVTTADIAAALEKEGFDINHRKIQLDEPIRQLGVYTVNVRLHPEVIAEIKVWVVKE